MNDAVDAILELGKQSDPFVMATLVATRGTSPKIVGAKMLVRSDGRVAGSVTIGGCVDANVIAAADSLLQRGGNDLISVELADEDALELGLSCGGVVEVFLEVVDTKHTALKAYELIDSGDSQGCVFVRAVLLGRPGELLFSDRGKILGNLENATLEEECARQARVRVDAGSSAISELGGEKVFFEVHAPQPILLVVGANDVAIELVELGSRQGYGTVVIDPRPRFATRARFPGAGRVVVGIPAELIGEFELGSSTHVAIVIHDPEIEIPVLQHVLGRETGYVGLFGGRTRLQGVWQMLRDRGVSDEAIRRVRAPIGLDIGARSSAEIALCILGEILAFRRGKLHRPIDDEV